MRAVAHGADQILDQVLQRHHRDHAAVGIAHQGKVAVALAQPGERIGQR